MQTGEDKDVSFDLLAETDITKNVVCNYHMTSITLICHHQTMTCVVDTTVSVTKIYKF